MIDYKSKPHRNWLSSTAYYIYLLPENLVHSAGIDWMSLKPLFQRRRYEKNDSLPFI